MKQIIQYQKTGELTIEELPLTQIKEGEILVKNVFSAVSAGTEKTSVSTAQASLVGKAKARPDLVRQVMDNVKKEGLISTINKVKNRLDNYKELGYSSAGIVIESKCNEFKVGDRVACAGVAYHSEVIKVPKNLAVKINNDVSFEEAAFTTIASIALQGVRQADVKIGEKVAVIGLGLIGLITVQLLKANGCSVVGIDINDTNFKLAKEFGCSNCFYSELSQISNIVNQSNGLGYDSVIITAGTKSNEPIELALEIARKRGTIVVVGAVGMNIPRSPFYEKELQLKISTSYGPGRYDKDYEEKGIDYPYPYVRWTENRNMQAILELLKQRKINFEKLITHIFPIEDGLKAYDLITGKTKEKYLGILISYPNDIGELNSAQKIKNNTVKVSNIKGKGINVGFIGAGNFAQSNLLPHIKGKANLIDVATSTPINAKSVSDKFGFQYFTTRSEEIFNDEKINTIFIATRHDSHGKYVIEALKHQKHVFVEKPLAITFEELENIKKFYNGNVYLMVGFNRRFSKPIKEIKQHFSIINEPLFINYRVNAGFIPKEHWIQDTNQGGRIIGEVCHFIDTLQFLIDSEIKSVYALSIRTENIQYEPKDTVNITLEFENGSVGNIQYIANGSSSVPKEYMEVFGGGSTAIMNNFKEVIIYSGRKKTKNKYDGSKGHKEEVEYFLNLINGKEEISLTFDSIYMTTLTTLKILESLQKQQRIEI